MESKVPSLPSPFSPMGAMCQESGGAIHNDVAKPKVPQICVPPQGGGCEPLQTEQPPRRLPLCTRDPRWPRAMGGPCWPRGSRAPGEQFCPSSGTLLASFASFLYFSSRDTAVGTGTRVFTTVPIPGIPGLRG